MASRVWQGLQWGLGLLIVAFVARSVVVNWDQVRQADLEWRIAPLPVAAGVVVVWLVFALLAESWRRMVGAWSHRLGPVEAARIWLLSSMAKYVPGKVWALAGMAVMARRRGVPPWAATGSAVILQLLSIGTGAVLVALSGLVVTQPAGAPGTFALAGLAAATAALTLLVFWPPVTRRIMATVAGEAGPFQARGLGAAGFGAGANLVAWLGYGVAFWLFARGTLPTVSLGLGESIGAYTASYVAGVIAPFAPGGLGVREGILVLVLKDRTGLANALALAAVARLGMVVAEIGAAVPFLLSSREAVRE